MMLRGYGASCIHSNDVPLCLVHLGLDLLAPCQAAPPKWHPIPYIVHYF